MNAEKMIPKVQDDTEFEDSHLPPKRPKQDGNPLLFPEILEHIMMYIGEKRKLRYVCKTFAQETSRNKKFYTQIFHPDEIWTILQDLHLNFISSNEMFRHISIGNQWSWESPLFPSLLELVGENVRRMEIVGTHLEIKKLLECIRHCPYLKELSLPRVTWVAEGGVDLSPYFVDVLKLPPQFPPILLSHIRGRSIFYLTEDSLPWIPSDCPLNLNHLVQLRCDCSLSRYYGRIKMEEDLIMLEIDRKVRGGDFSSRIKSEGWMGDEGEAVKIGYKLTRLMGKGVGSLSWNNVIMEKALQPESEMDDQDLNLLVLLLSFRKTQLFQWMRDEDVEIRMDFDEEWGIFGRSINVQNCRKLFWELILSKWSVFREEKDDLWWLMEFN